MVSFFYETEFLKHIGTALALGIFPLSFISLREIENRKTKKWSFQWTNIAYSNLSTQERALNRIICVAFWIFGMYVIYTKEDGLFKVNETMMFAVVSSMFYTIDYFTFLSFSREQKAEPVVSRQ